MVILSTKLFLQVKNISCEKLKNSIEKNDVDMVMVKKLPCHTMPIATGMAFVPKIKSDVWTYQWSKWTINKLKDFYNRSSLNSRARTQKHLAFSLFSFVIFWAERADGIGDGNMQFFGNNLISRPYAKSFHRIVPTRHFYIDLFIENCLKIYINPYTLLPC